MGPSSPRAALGEALVARADDVEAMVRSRWDEKVLASSQTLATIADSDRLATQLIGRWLVVSGNRPARRNMRGSRRRAG